MYIDLSVLPAARQNVYRFYSLDFAVDGTPMKRIGDRLIFHPILAPYLICDFVDEYQKTSRSYALQCAVHIAERALLYASAYCRESLVYWYHPESQLSLLPIRFYSGLTQAWYVKAFIKLSGVEGRFSTYVKPLFNSLTVPVAEGGTLLERSFGWVVEEYPFEPPLYTFNGWLTVLRILLENKNKLSEIDGFLLFIENNLRAVQYLLPLYDAEFCKNSRYQLTGFTRIKLVLSKEVEHKVNRFEVIVPAEGGVVGDVSGEKRSRWCNFLERQEGRLIQFNVVLSIVGYPAENQIIFDVSVNADCSVKCFIADGDYDPLLSAAPTRRWVSIGEFLLKAGQNSFSVSIPYDDRNIFAYPTNFKKALKGGAGIKFNVYHFVHIVDLAILYRATGVKVFKDYFVKWMGYFSEWPNLDFLPANKVSLQPYDADGFQSRVRKYIDDEP